ncbi:MULTISPECIES: STAS domain-containing protein [Kitasatospora]|uniref:Anti-sigma factor antagonist n=1 Tax=Kitasatospora setae (strain ATCC 33774 / DSM 43861 / JCM 3304 / KCC A-0304 / NBRC 14216 / KM-6054) TaxID=452652 RepID=E4N3B7_KITSK|nr:MULTISPECIES: STAS domain-containing protein [Kitasatospora]BAJ32651.1 putative antagonist protein [Kitasatospora setae KM-6054]
MPAENTPVAPLAVDVRRTPSRAAVCALAGDLDIETLAPAREALDLLVAELPRALIVDLGRVDFCDSSGLNLLLQTRMAAADGELPFHLAALSGPVRHLLELTGAKAVFTIHETVDAALAAAG